MFIHAAVERLAPLLLNKCVGPVGRHEVAWAGNPSWWQTLTTEMNTKYDIIILIRSLSTSITIVILIIRSRLLFCFIEVYIGRYKNIVGNRKLYVSADSEVNFDVALPCAGFPRNQVIGWLA